jgi:hypothetical protein
VLSVLKEKLSGLTIFLYAILVLLFYSLVSLKDFGT